MFEEFVIVNPPFEIVQPAEPVAEAPREDDYIIVFTARWCGICRRSTTAADLKKLGYRVLIVDVDDEPNEKVKFGVTSLPAYAVIDGKKRTQLGSTLTGLRSASMIDTYASSFIYISKEGSHVNRASLVKHLVKEHNFSEADLKNLTASQLDILHERDHDAQEAKGPGNDTGGNK
jgi:flavin-dependent dehydrogenase